MNWIKGSLKSKSIWFNFIFIVVFIASQAGFQEFRPDSTVVEILNNPVVIGLINIAIRYLTKQAIPEKASQAK